jgi:hypothetical protein
MKKVFATKLVVVSARVVGFGMMLAALSGSVSAHGGYAPEIGPDAMASAVALLTGGILMVTARGRRKKSS